MGKDTRGGKVFKSVKFHNLSHSSVACFPPVLFLPKDEGPTARDLMVRYSTGRKTTKNKKKMEKAMRVLKVSSESQGWCGG